MLPNASKIADFLSAKVFPKLRRLDVALIVALGLFGFVGAITFVIEGETDGLRLVLNQPIIPRVHLWLILIGAQGALWGVSLVLLASWWRMLIQDPWPTWPEVLFRFLIPIALLAAAAIWPSLGNGSSGWPPSRLGPVPIGNLPTFSKIGIAVAWIAVSGMFVVGVRARTNIDKDNFQPDQLRYYLVLQRLQESFLLVAALVLGLGTLATAALRDAYNASVGMDAFAKDYVILYGGVYSIFLAIAYGASRSNLIVRGRWIQDTLLGDPPLDAAKLKDWKEHRDALDTLFRLRLSGLSALGEAFSVLTPLLVAAISVLLEGRSVL